MGAGAGGGGGGPAPPPAARPDSGRSRTSRWNAVEVNSADGDLKKLVIYIPEDCAARIVSTAAGLLQTLQTKHGVFIHADAGPCKNDSAKRAITIQGKSQAQIDACKESIESKVVDAEMYDAELLVLASAHGKRGANSGAGGSSSVGGGNGGGAAAKKSSSPPVQTAWNSNTLSCAPVSFNDGAGGNTGDGSSARSVAPTAPALSPASKYQQQLSQYRAQNHGQHLQQHYHRTMPQQQQQQHASYPAYGMMPVRTSPPGPEQHDQKRQRLNGGNQYNPKHPAT